MKLSVRFLFASLLISILAACQTPPSAETQAEASITDAVTQKNTPAQGAETSPNVLEDVKVYEGDKGFRFSYPAAYTLEPEAEKSSSIRFVDKNGQLAFWVEESDLKSMGNPGETQEEVYNKNSAYYLDNAPVGLEQISGLEAKKFVLEASGEDCGGPDCLSARTTFLFHDKSGGRMVKLIFENRMEAEINTVIYSFELI